MIYMHFITKNTQIQNGKPEATMIKQQGTVEKPPRLRDFFVPS